MLPPLPYLPRRLRGGFLPRGMGYLISGGASRLDAFSAYPLPARLPGGAPGGAAGTPAASPPRSSRTRGGSFQISCARTG